MERKKSTVKESTMYLMTHKKLCQGPTPMLTVTMTFKKQKPKKRNKKKGKTIIYRLGKDKPQGEGEQGCK
jgi:hypothetical protein